MKNEKTHSILLTLVGGYMLYLAYQLFGKYRAGTKEMPDAVFILAILLFTAAGIGIWVYAWRIYRKQKKDSRQHTGNEENGPEGNADS